jgi:hypothetical protein
MAKQTFTTGQVLTAAQMTSLQQTAMGGGSATAKTASYVLVAADAGTVVQMNSASATTITVNTALFAAGDSVTIQNIGTGVCTVTAGTATVNTAGSLALSQYEGGQLYFNTTSAAIFFDIVQTSGMTNPLTTTGDTIYSSSGTTPARLGIGSTGQVLTVASGIPSWATPASGVSSWSLLNTGGTALTGATTVTVSGLSAKQIMVFISGASTANASDYIYVRPNADSTVANYSAFGVQNTPLAVYSAPSFNRIDNHFTASTAYFPVARQSDANNDFLAGAVVIEQADTTQWKKIAVTGGANINGTGAHTQYAYNGLFKSTSAITSILVGSTGGNLDAGTVYIYGGN